MSLPLRLRTLWWNFVRRPAVERALDDELRSYVELLTAEYERRGYEPDAARRAALIECGGAEQVKEATRDAWLGNHAVMAWRDLRQIVRSLKRAPVFVATAVLTLGIGIGSASALFTIVKGSLLRPLPAVAHPDRLVSVEPVQGNTLLYDISYPDFLDFQHASTSFAGLALYDGTSMAFRDSLESGRAMVSYVSGAFFSVLGVQPAAGRLLVPADAVPGSVSPAVVISYEFWQAHFGGSKAVIGTRLTLDGYPLTIVGVAPKEFVGAMATHAMNMWIPLTMVSTIMMGQSSPNDSRRDAVVAWLVGCCREKPSPTRGAT